MKQQLLKQLTTKRLILLVLSFMMLMPSTAWGAASFYAVLSGDGKTVTFYYDDQMSNRGGQDIFSTIDRFYAEATTAIFDASVANYKPSSLHTLFYNCSALTSIKGLENLNTSEVVYMNSMFQGCSSLTSLDLTSFDTSNLTIMNGMFAYCSSLTSIDLSSFNTSKVTDMGGLFAECSNLETIYVDEARWSTAAVTSENNGNGALFYNCGPLVGGNGTAYYDTYKEDLDYARVDKPGQPGYLTDKNATPVENGSEPYIVPNSDKTVWTFYYDDQKESRGGQNLVNSSFNFPTTTQIVFDASFANYTSLTSLESWFALCNNMTSIIGMENLYTANVTDMSNMFLNCYKLTSLDVSQLNTEKVTNMKNMFQGCKLLTSIDLSNFNTANVTDMAGMFVDCSKLTSLDVSKFNTANVTNMNGMFDGCSALTSLDVSNFNTAKVKSMRWMFQGCSNMKTIYAGRDWTTASVTQGDAMFYGCTKIVGGAGTTYDANYLDYTYARIDGGTTNPGYFTRKDGSATESCDMSEIPTDNAYYAATSFLCERGVLDGSKVDGKYMVGDPLKRQHLANITFRGLFTLKGREIPSTFVSDQYPDVYDDLKSDASYYQAAKVLLYLDYGDGITPFDRDRDGFLPNDNEARINILKELMEAFNIKPDTEGTDNPFPNDPNIAQLSEASPIKMGYVRQAAKLGIITTENEQFRPYDDCLRGEAFLMLARIIQKIEAGEITDPNPQESDFLDPNSGTGTAEPYAVLSDDNTVLTFYYDNKKESRGGIDINNTYIMPGSSSPYGTATTASFDASFANYKPTSTAYWFQRCSSLTTITGMENLKTGNVTSMECMFSYCSSLTSLDLSNFNTVSVTTMSEMFYGCSGLTSLDVSSFNTANVTNMSLMFYNCSGLTSLDLSNFNTANVTLMGSMFSGCSGLITIYVGNGWTTTSLTTGAWMFEGCTNLVGGAGTVVVEANNYKYTGESYAHIDGGTDNPGYFTEKSATPVEGDAEPYAVLSDDNTVLTFYYDGKKESRGGLSVGPFTTNFTSSWYRQRESITNVVFDESFANCTSLTSTAKWFDGLQNLSSITGISNLKTDNVTNMNNMFYDCSGLTSLDLSGFKTDNVTDMGGMFDGCSGLTSLDVTGFKTDNVTNMYSMFSGCSGLTSLDVTGFKTDKVTSVAFMFYGCSGLTSLDVTGFKTDNVIYMSGMFSCCSGLKSLDVTGFKTDNVTDMRDMFYICSSLTSLDVTGFKTDNVTDMQDMFSGCIALTSLDVTGFKTKNVTVMGGMFGFCTSLTSLDVTNFETDNVEYMTQMFDGCRGLTSLDLTGFKTDNVTSMHWMFRNCPSLKTIYVGDGWSTAKVQNGENMFEGCTSLVGGAGTTYDANYTGHAYAHIDGGTDNPGYFTDKSAAPVEGDAEPYAVLSDNNTVLTFYYDGKKESRGGLSVGPFTNEEDPAWNTYRESVSSVVFDESFANCTTLTSTAYWFYNCSSLTGITGISNLKTDHVTNMMFMFHGCESLTSIDVSGFKTDNVENMQGMFFRCEQLTSMDLSGFNTEKVTNMSALFSRCVGMTSVDLSGFKTDLVTSMRLMFNQCSSLTSLNLTDFNTENVTDMGYMFADCSSLKTIYVSNTGWSFSQLLDGTNMFKNCTGLVGGAGTTYDSNHTDYTYAHIDGGTSNPGYFTGKDATPVVEDNSEPYAVFDNGTLTFYYDEEKQSRGGYEVGPFVLDEERWGDHSANITTVVFDPSFANCTSLTSTAYWFFECYNLTTIKGIENLKTGNVTDMSAMFYQCKGLTSLDLTNMDTRNVTNMMCMFMYCSGLTSLNLKGFNTAKVTDMDCMFRSCTKLGSLDLSDFDTGNVTNMWCMFFDCPKLTTLDVSSFDTGKVTSMSSMFQDCSGLTALDVSSFNTGSVTDMSYMFDRCTSLKTIDVSGFDTKSVTDFRCMFYGCSELTTIYCNDTWSTQGESSQMFEGCEKLVGGNGTTYDADHKDVAYARVDGGADASGYFTPNSVVDENIEYKYWSGTGLIAYSAKDDTRDLYIKGTVIVDDVERPVTAIGEGAFEDNTMLEEISIPATITLFGARAFAGCINLKAIYLYIRIPVDITSSKARTRGDGVSAVFEGVNTETCTLYVPAGSGDSYRNAEGWKEFKNIVEMGKTFDITIGKNGKTTFCGDMGLDFSYSDEVKAFIATGFDKESSTIWMTRVKDVPAGVPVMIKGTAEETYHVPVTDGGTSSYKNMFVGNTSGESISIGKTSEDGQYVNYYMSGGQFKSVNGSANIGNNKCYLQLPANFEAEATGEGYQVKIAASGKSSFAAPCDLDFTDLGDDVKAFTATGYDAGTKTIWLTRVKKVQKGEGLLLKGTGGETYTIPSSGVQAAYVNMIVGNIGDEIAINGTSKNGNLTNYYLKGGTYVSVSGNANIGKNKSYLQLPTYLLAGTAGARSEASSDVLGTLGVLDNLGMPSTFHLAELETESMPIVLGETTGVKDNNRETITNNRDDEWFTISGQRIDKPTKKGLYIHNGKKVVVK